MQQGSWGPSFIELVLEPTVVHILWPSKDQVPTFCAHSNFILCLYYKISVFHIYYANAVEVSLCKLMDLWLGEITECEYRIGNIQHLSACISSGTLIKKVKLAV